MKKKILVAQCSYVIMICIGTHTSYGMSFSHIHIKLFLRDRNDLVCPRLEHTYFIKVRTYLEKTSALNASNKLYNVHVMLISYFLYAHRAK